MSEQNPLEDSDLLELIRARINSGFDLVGAASGDNPMGAFQALQFMEFLGLLQELHDMLAATIRKGAKP